MEYKLDIADSGNTISFIGNEDVFVDGERVTEIYVDYEDEEFLVWRYDVTPPTVIVSNVTNNSEDYTLTDMDNFTVTMTAVDYDSGIASITVNSVAATNTENNTWTATIPLVEGQQTLVVKATDIAGNSTQQTCYIQKLTKTVRYNSNLTVNYGFSWFDGCTPYAIPEPTPTQYKCRTRHYIEDHREGARPQTYLHLARVMEPAIKRVKVTEDCQQVYVYRCDGVIVYRSAGAQTIDIASNGWNSRLFYVVIKGTRQDGGYISTCFGTIECLLD